MDNSADHVASTRRQRARNHQRSPSASGHAASPRQEESNRLFSPCSSSGRRKGNAEGKKFIVEGKVRIQGAEHNEVFYNPVQVFNRDLSIVAIKAFAEMQKEEIRRRGARALDRIQSEGKPAVTPLKFVGFNVVEPLAATGLRSLRYLVELEGVVKSVVANDMDPHAVATMKKNAALNGVSLAHLFVTCTEATRLLYGLAFPANISHGTLKKLCSLPAGSSVPHTFDLTPLHAGLPSVPLSLFLHEEACRQQAQQQQTQRQGPEKQHEQQEMQQQRHVRASAGLGGAAEPLISPSTNPLLSAGETPRAETTHVAAAAAADHSAAASCGTTSCAASLPPPPPPRASAAGVAAAAQGAAAGETTGRAGVEGEAASAAPAGSEEEEKKGLCDGLPVCFDIVDIDPYGSVSPFLDAAIQAVRPGGMLCLTSTDMPVLCGNAPETTFYKYGGAAVKAKYIHEMALRLIIYAASSSAAKYKKVVVPLLACSVDFYVRLFLQVFDSAERCRDFHSQAAIVQQCVACDAFRVLPLGSVAAGAAADSGGAAAAAGEGETAAAGGGVGGGGGGQAATAGGGGRAEGGEEEVRELQKAEPWQESQQTQQQEAQQSPAGPERKQQEDSAGRQLDGESAEEKRPKDGAQQLVETPEECEEEGKAKKKTEEEKRRSVASNKRRRAAYFPADMTPCCSECGQRTLLGGPFYAGPLYQQEFVEKCLNICASAKEHLPGITMGTRITGVLTAIKQELREVPLFYHLPSLCQKMRLEMLRPAAVRAALVRLGYKVSHFHRDPQAIKTDASSTVVFDILRTHAQRHPPAHGAKVPLLMKEIT